MAFYRKFKKNTIHITQLMEKPNWRSQAPTDRQINAIKKLSTALNRADEIPKTKGECSDLITKLITKVSARSHFKTNDDHFIFS
jgi:hypothetical protein